MDEGAAKKASSISGFHHVTMIAGNVQRNLEFYVGLLGQRLVKRTVNLDDPGTYHLRLRQYYHSVYIRALGGIDFVITTDPPQGDHPYGRRSSIVTNPDLGFVHRYEQGPETRTLLLLHGTGGDENDLLDLGQMLAPGWSMLSPRGKVLESGAPRFFRRLAMGVFDMEDLVIRTHELADFVSGAAGAYGFNPKQVVAAGYSNGANIAASTLLLRPGTLRAAVLLRPVMPLTPPNRPDLSGVAVFIAAARQDPYSPVEQTERLATYLQESGADVQVNWISGGHGLVRPELATAAAWVEKLA